MWQGGVYSCSWFKSTVVGQSQWQRWKELSTLNPSSGTGVHTHSHSGVFLSSYIAWGPLLRGWHHPQWSHLTTSVSILKVCAHRPTYSGQSAIESHLTGSSRLCQVDRVKGHTGLGPPPRPPSASPDSSVLKSD